MIKTPSKREFHPPHIYRDNSCYFITSAVVGRRPFFDTDANRILLRDLLKEEIMTLGFSLYAWVILSDHYHLLLKTKSTPIHTFIQRLHSKSAIELNKLDQTPGRSVWHQYWDRFPRSDRDFWSYLNYIHINPINHGYVRIADGALWAEDRMVRIAPAHLLDVHDCLAQYPHSSYHFYRREHGTEFLTNAWLSFPIPDYLAHDDFWLTTNNP
ncbi:MAG TPA: transposase [Anaerolineae bacterium]|nr:transposase [Anaerolineae bacterium]